MPKHRVKMIVNPNANLGRAWHYASDLRSIVDSYGGADWSGTVYPTHATELARQAVEEGYEIVIAAGGDGTVHEVVNALMAFPPAQRPRLGVVPLGSGNDFSHAAGYSRQPTDAIRQIFTGSPIQVDVGSLCDGQGRREYWSNTIGIGFDTIVTLRSRNIPFFSGFPIFLIAVLQTILLDNHAARIKVSSDRESWEEQVLLFVLCNGGREGGGFFVQPHAQVGDGVFHYTGIEKVSQLRMLRLLPEVMKGTHERFPDIRMGEFLKLSIVSDRPLYIHTDGEIFAGFGMDVRQLEVEIHPGSLEVLV